MDNHQNRDRSSQVETDEERGAPDLIYSAEIPSRVIDMDAELAAQVERQLNTSIDTIEGRPSFVNPADLQLRAPSSWPQLTVPQETLPSQAPAGRADWDLPEFNSLYPDLFDFDQIEHLQGDDHVLQNIDLPELAPETELPELAPETELPLNPEVLEVASPPSTPSPPPALPSLEHITSTAVSQHNSEKGNSPVMPSSDHSEESSSSAMASTHDSEESESSSSEDVKPRRRRVRKLVTPKSASKTKRVHNADGTPRKTQIPKDYSSAIELPAGGETSQGVHKKLGKKCLTCVKYERGCKGTLVKDGRCETCGGKTSQKRVCLWADKANGIQTYEQAQDFKKSRRIQQNTSEGIAARKKARGSPTLEEKAEAEEAAESSSDEVESPVTSSSPPHYQAVEAPGPAVESAEGGERPRIVIMNTAFLATLQRFRDELSARNERAATTILAAIHVARGNQQRVVDILNSPEGQHQAFADELQHLRDQLSHGTVPVVQRQYGTDERMAIMENALELRIQLLNQVYAILRMAGLQPFNGLDLRLIPNWAISAIDYILRNL